MNAVLALVLGRRQAAPGPCGAVGVLCSDVKSPMLPYMMTTRTILADTNADIMNLNAALFQRDSSHTFDHKTITT